MEHHMLTTIDNPYDPFDAFDEWYSYDIANGYNTLGLLARVAVFSEDLSEADQDMAIELAIQEIVTENVTGIHTRILEPTD